MTRSSYTWTPPWLRRGDEWEVGFEKFKILHILWKPYSNKPWCDAIPCSPHLMGPDLELEPLECPGPSRQVLPAKWCQWCHATKGMGIFIAFIPMECWKPSRLPASVALVLFLDQNTPSSIAEMGTSTAKCRKEFAVHLASKTGKNKHQTKLSVSLQEWTEQLTRSISFTQMYLQYYILS